MKPVHTGLVTIKYALYIHFESHIKTQFTKLGRIIRLKNIIRKYSVFVSLFRTRIGSKQASLFVLYKKQIPFLKSNNVEYCRILSNTVNVRKPDVRFGEPDEKTSGFQHVRISDVRFITKRPVIKRLLYLKRPITGRYIRISDDANCPNVR